MKKTIVTLLLAVVCATSFAQLSKLPQRLSLVEISSDIAGNKERLEVFNMPQDDVNSYYLSVGHLGIGDEVVQIMFDPICELFIPLGGTVAEALETFQQLQGLFKEPEGTCMEIQGCLSVAFPGDELETVSVTFRKPLLSRMLEFSLRRGDYIRATHIQRSDFNSLVSGVRLYGKIHPKE